jgi:hypothetical protein
LTRSDAHSAISLNIACIRTPAVLSVADKVIGAVKSGALNHMFLVGGSGQLLRLVLGVVLQQQLGDERVHLPPRLLRHVGQDHREVAYPLRLLHFQNLCDRRGRQLADLRIYRTEHRVGIHHDAVGRQRNERSSAHRIVRHEHRHLALVLSQRAGDLLRGPG